MSLLPKVAGQSVAGDGMASGAPALGRRPRGRGYRGEPAQQAAVGMGDLVLGGLRRESQDGVEVGALRIAAQVLVN